MHLQAWEDYSNMVAKVEGEQEKLLLTCSSGFKQILHVENADKGCWNVVPCRARGRDNMMDWLSCICKSLGRGGVSHAEMLQQTGGRVLMAVCWRCGSSWRNSCTLMCYSERNAVSRGKNLWTWTTIGPQFPQRLDLLWRTRTDALSILYMAVHKPLITVSLPLLLPSLPCPLLVISSTYIYFSWTA